MKYLNLLLIFFLFGIIAFFVTGPYNLYSGFNSSIEGGINIGQILITLIIDFIIFLKLKIIFQKDFPILLDSKIIKKLKFASIVLLAISIVLFFITDPFIIGYFTLFDWLFLNASNFFFVIVATLFYLSKNDPKVVEKNDQLVSDDIKTNQENIVIPDTCPHCKNPNVKKIRLCEWCGGQIC